MNDNLWYSQAAFDVMICVWVVLNTWRIRTPKFLKGVDPLAVPAFLNRKRRVFFRKASAAAKAWEGAE